MANVLFNTLWLVAGVVGVTIPAGACAAWLCTLHDWPGRRWVIAAGVLWLFLPVFLQASAWDAALGRQGWIGPWLGWGGQPLLSGWRGAWLLQSVVMLPWATLLIAIGLRDVEPELIEQGWLDAGPVRTAWSVVLPRARGALALAAAWVTALTASDMTITDMFQVRTCAEVLYADFALDESPWRALWQSLPSLLAVAACCAGALALAWSWYPVGIRVARRGVEPIRWGGWWVTASLGTGALLALGLPLGSLLVKLGTVARPVGDQWVRSWSPGHATRILAGTWPEFRDEFFWTGLLTILAATLATLLSGLLAWWARRRRGRVAGMALVGTLWASLPGPLVAVMLVAVRASWGGAWLDGLAERSLAFPVLFLTLKALPVGVACAWLAFRSLPREMIEALEMDGMSGLGQLLRVALPLRWRMVAVVWACAACLSAGDLAGTILLLPGGVSTVSVRTFQLVHAGVDDRLAGLCLFATSGYAIAALCVRGMLGSTRGNQ